MSRWWMLILCLALALNACVPAGPQAAATVTAAQLSPSATPPAAPTPTPAPSPTALPSATSAPTVEPTPTLPEGWAWHDLGEVGLLVGLPPTASLMDSDDGKLIELPYDITSSMMAKDVRLARSALSEAQCYELLQPPQLRLIQGAYWYTRPGTQWEGAMGGKRYYITELALWQDGFCYTATARLGWGDLLGFMDNPPPTPMPVDLDVSELEAILDTLRIKP